MHWSNDCITELKALYANYPTIIAAVAFDVSDRAIKSAAFKHRIKKANYYWDIPEEEFLLANYKVLGTFELTQTLNRKFKVNRTRNAVVNKYRELAGLR